MTDMRRIFIVLGLTGWLMATGLAQPERQAGAATPGQGQAVAVPAGPLTAAEAGHYFNLLGEIIGRCPLADQDTFWDMANDLGARYGQRPAQRPSADGEAQLAARVRETYARLRTIFPAVEVVVGTRGVDVVERAPIELARGLSRYILVEVRNETNAPLTIEGGPADGRGREGSEVPPGAMRPFFREIKSENLDDQSLAVPVHGGGIDLSSKGFPVRVSEPATLRGTLIDSDTGEVFPGRVHIQGADGLFRRDPAIEANETLSEKMVPRQFLRGQTYRWTFFYSDGHFEVPVPAGETSLTLERGFEHAIVTTKVTLAPGERREVTLQSGRIIDMARLGWYSGDTHVHWVKNPWNIDEDIKLLPWIQRAEDLRVANNLILRHHRPPAAEFTTPTYLPVGPAPGMCGPDYHIEMAEEYRNEPFYGHLIFLNLKKLVQPISTGAGIMGEGAIDYPINRTAILEARGQGGIVIEAHGLTADGPANIIDGVTDSLDQFQPADYYKVLNAGFRLPLTNGSDHPMRAIGFVRAYVKVDGEFTYQKWIDGIRARRTFTTAGPLLFLTVNGREMGEEVAVKQGDPIEVKARVVSRLPLGHFQLVTAAEDGVGGKVIKEVATEAREAEIEWRGTAGESTWFAVRNSDRPIWRQDVGYMVHYGGNVAHSSAVYVVVDGKPIFRPEAAAALREMLQAHAAMVAEKGVYENEAQRQEALKVYRDAIGAYDQLAALYAGGRTQAKR